ncbi:hypothetical protein JCM1840_005833 [Sporobolomyces johnsonii]
MLHSFSTVFRATRSISNHRQPHPKPLTTPPSTHCIVAGDKMWYTATIQVLSLPPQQQCLHSSFCYLFTVSKDATPLKITGLIKDDLNSTLPTGSMSTPLKVYDAASSQSVFVLLAFHLGVHDSVHDGPMKSILTSTTTSRKASHPVGSPPCTPAQTCMPVLNYLDLTTHPLTPKKDLSSCMTLTSVVNLVTFDIVSSLQSNVLDHNSFIIYCPRPTPELAKDQVVKAKENELQDLRKELLKESGHQWWHQATFTA